MLVINKVDMALSEVALQATAGLLIKDEHDIAMPSTSQTSGSMSESLDDGIDDIGGYYDENARSPESESHQYNDTTSIGIDASDVLTLIISILRSLPPLIRGPLRLARQKMMTSEIIRNYCLF